MAADLTDKYNQERAKRLRADASSQYVNTRSAGLQDLAADPWADYAALAAQEPPFRDGGSTKVLIVGGGHAGIVIAARLVLSGAFTGSDIVIVDTAGGLGGTWYWNRYPGLMCDVEGYCYLPLLEETGYVPQHKYSYGAEIRGQSERVAKQFGIQAMLCTKVDSQIWREDRGRWEVQMTQSLGHVRGPTALTVDAQFLIVTGGVLSLPKVPRAPGFADFRARHAAFHTARWDYGVTGGSQEVPDMEKLRGKRVAIIGTGATGVQAIPHLARWAEHLYVVQRTPSYCGPRGQQETTPESWATVTASGPGWQKRRIDNLNSHLTANPEEVDLVADGWSRNGGRAGLIGGSGWKVTPDTVPDHVRRLLELDTPIAEELRARVSETVKDPAVAEKLKPWYGGWCKRPTFNDDYLETFNRSNVTLVDTDGKGIRAFTERGLVVAGGDHEGAEIEIDVLVLGTGFSTGGEMDPSQRADAPIIGVGGLDLSEACADDDSFCNLFGVAMPGFPNAFFPHAGLAASYNMTSAYEAAARVIAHVLRTAETQPDVVDLSRLVVEADREAADKWSDAVAEKAAWFAALAGCTPSYFNREAAGSVEPPAAPEKQARQARKAPWGAGMLDYQRVTGEYMARTAEKLEGWETRQAPGAVAA
ncbi:pentalenolactone D synthase [Microdochium nivale]|nr:pentalenolactone D synthase [Microdochium nivale]